MDCELDQLRRALKSDRPLELGDVNLAVGVWMHRASQRGFLLDALTQAPDEKRYEHAKD